MTEQTQASVDYVLYEYTPSLPGNATMLAAFTILTGYHIALYCLRRQNMYIPLIIGGIMEIAGIACRTWGHFETFLIAPYAVQGLLILIAPTLFAATIYMGLSRTIRAAHAEACSPIRVRLLTLTFVLGDVTSFMVQSTGGGLQAKTDPDAQISGLYIAVGGLVIQIILLAGFIWVAILVLGRISASTDSNDTTTAKQSSYKIFVLVGTAALILIRSLIRIVEFAMGKSGYLLVKEWPLLVLDLAFMAVLMLALGIIYMPDPKAIDNDVETKAEAAVRH